MFYGGLFLIQFTQDSGVTGIPKMLNGCSYSQAVLVYGEVFLIQLTKCSGVIGVPIPKLCEFMEKYL